MRYANRRRKHDDNGDDDGGSGEEPVADGRRPIVDRTGLAGTFDLDLTWTPDQQGSPSTTVTPAPAGDTVSLFTAIQEQLGLKLDVQRAPIETLVIDSAQRPMED